MVKNTTELDEFIAARNEAVEQLGHALGYLNMHKARPTMSKLIYSYDCSFDSDTRRYSVNSLGTAFENSTFDPLLSYEDQRVDNNDAIEYWGLRVHVCFYFAKF